MGIKRNKAAEPQWNFYPSSLFFTAIDLLKGYYSMSMTESGVWATQS